jgi:hypothetical protein
VAGHVRFELRNVVANYPFESSRGFPRSEPNSGHADHSRLSCSGGDTQLGGSSAFSCVEYAPCWTRASHTRSTIGTELAFSEDVKWAPFSLLSWRLKVIESRTATFRQVNTHIPRVHHDTLEFADGTCVLLTDLLDGQEATVLQIPAQPKTPAEEAAQARHFAGLAFAGQEPSRFRSPAQAGLSFEGLVMCVITPHSSLCRRLARKSLGQI